MPNGVKTSGTRTIEGFEVWNRREDAGRDAMKELILMRRRIYALRIAQPTSWDQVAALGVLEQGMRNLRNVLETMPDGVGEAYVLRTVRKLT
jgi:hypothetical protein